MKLFKIIYSVIIACYLLSTNIFCYDEPLMPNAGPISMDQISQDEMDLAKLTEDLMGSMTPEQRAEVDQELARFMALPEDQQGEYLENKFKELSVDLEKAEALQKEEQPEIPEFQEEVKFEKKEVKPLLKIELTKVKQVQNSLKKIIIHVQPLILKTKVLPQVSKDFKIEQDWLSLTDSLVELNSFAKVISNKENLINLLASEEFLLLRDQLKNIANILEENESKIIVPDTAGLTINYDEEDAQESTKIIQTAQNKLNLFIPKLKILVEDDQILWGLRRLLQKYAPEELKKVEAEKKVEKKFIADFKPGKETPSTATPKYNEPYFPYYGGGAGYTPSSSASSDRPSLLGSSSDKSAGRGGGKSDKGGAKDKSGKDGKDKEGKEKESKEGKDKKDKKDKDKPSSPDSKSFNDLKNTLEKISQIAKESKILDLIKDEKDKPDTEIDKENTESETKTEAEIKSEKELEKEKKAKQDKQVKELLKNSRDLVASFTQINMNYDKAAKLVTKINNSIKSASEDDKKFFQVQIKGLFENPELKLKKIDKAYDLIKNQLDKKLKRSSADTSSDELTPDQQLQKQVYSALKLNKDLKEALGIKKPKSEKDKKADLSKPDLK